MSVRAASRLDRLVPALSFDERLDGLLAAYREERHADPRLLSTMPPSDNRRWNEAAHILNAVHSRLGWLIDYLEACVTQVELRLALAEQSRLAALLLEDAGRDEIMQVAEKLAMRAAGHLGSCWLDLRLIEAALAHLGEQVGGRELPRDGARAMLAGCRSRLLGVQERLARQDGFALEFELPEPPEDALGEMLDLLLREKSLP